jgi:L-glyceraldehyde 3-phosphate reductase
MSTVLPHRALGTSGIDVSVLSLGSWMTFEHMSRDDGVAVMRAAREAGIDFLDDARYDDRTGTAPIPTGYSEVRFGELFRASGWRREDAVVANKLWLEFWPDQAPAAELDASLERMGFDYLDLVYCAPPPDGFPLADLVDAVGALVVSGTARAWGVLNWSPSLLRDSCTLARERGVAGPCAAQLPYNLVSRFPVEDPATVAALEGCGAGVVASAVLAGGALSGKYGGGGSRASGRLAGVVDAPRLAPVLQAAEQLGALAHEMGVTPAALAVAFALSNPTVASVLFGATSVEQVDQNVRALDVLVGATDAQLDALRRVGAQTNVGG